MPVLTAQVVVAAVTLESSLTAPAKQTPYLSLVVVAELAGITTAARVAALQVAAEVTHTEDHPHQADRK
jgi:small basic protein